MADIYVSSKSGLLSALSSAKAGDTILLAPGNYGAVKLSDIKFSNYVTLRSADPDNRAVLQEVEFDNSAYIRLDDLVIDKGPQSGARLVEINASDHIDVVNSEIIGDGPVSKTYGFYTNDGVTNLTISNNYVHDIGVGITVFSAKDVVVSENLVDYVYSDFYKFGGVEDLLFENNTGGGHLYPGPTTHADFVQFQGSATDAVLRGNVFLAQNNERAQGLFFSDAYYSNILIEDNIVYSGKINAIKVVSGENITVKNNTLLSPPDVGHDAAVVSVPSGSVVENNIYTNKSGGTAGSNIVVQYENPNGAYHYDDLFANADTGLGVQLEDLIPVKGSAAETKGAYNRLAELLEGGDTDWQPAPAPAPAPTPEPTPQPEPDVKPEPEPTPQPDSGNSDQGSVVVPTPGTAFAMTGDLEVSGSGNVLEVAHSKALEMSSGTLAFSFNADTVSGTRGLVSKDAYGDGHHFTSYIKSGSLYIRFQDGDSSETIRVNGIKANTDYDVQIAVGEGSATVWLNGAVVDTAWTDLDWSQNAEYLQIGGNGWASKSGESGFKNTFDGTISDVVFVDGVKTPAELAAILDGETPSSGGDQGGTPPTDGGTDDGDDTAGGDQGGTDTGGDSGSSGGDPAPIPASAIFSLDGDIEFYGSKKDIVNEAHKSALEISEGTISFSFNADSVSGRSGLISKDAYGYEGGGDHFSAWVHKGKLYIRFQDGENDAVFKAGNIKANQTYDVTAYFKEGEVGVYLDGELLGTSVLTMDWTDNAEYLQVGGLGWASDTGDDAVRNAFDGTISDVMILDEVLTPQEVDLIV